MAANNQATNSNYVYQPYQSIYQSPQVSGLQTQSIRPGPVASVHNVADHPPAQRQQAQNQHPQLPQQYEQQTTQQQPLLQIPGQQVQNLVVGSVVIDKHGNQYLVTDQPGIRQNQEQQQPYFASQREYENYQGRQADVRGTVNYEIPSHEHNSSHASSGKFNEFLHKGLSLKAMIWSVIGLIILGGGLTTVILSFDFSKSASELAIGLLILGVLCVLVGVMVFVKGTITCYRNLKEPSSIGSTSASAPLMQ